MSHHWLCNMHVYLTVVSPLGCVYLFIPHIPSLSFVMAIISNQFKLFASLQHQPIHWYTWCSNSGQSVFCRVVKQFTVWSLSISLVSDTFVVALNRWTTLTPCSLTCWGRWTSSLRWAKTVLWQLRSHSFIPALHSTSGGFFFYLFPWALFN